MNSAVLIGLAKTCEELSGPSRELDALIQAEIENRDVIWEGNRALGRRRTPPHDTCLIGDVDPGRVQRNFGIAWSSPECPFYTASIDAAAQLVPSTFKWKLGYSRHVPHVAEVVDYSCDKGTFVSECDGTRALALCAAALRARASTLFPQQRSTSPAVKESLTTADTTQEKT